jgi:hypothetical protein
VGLYQIVEIVKRVGWRQLEVELLFVCVGVYCS